MRRGRIRFLLISLAALALPVGIMALIAASGSPGERALDLASLPSRTAAQYRAAEAHAAMYEEIACYCGCGPTLGHRHLRDCFVRDDGTYDDHAAGCGICLVEAADVERMLDGGVPAADIARVIDETYGAVGPPTLNRARD